MNTTKYVIKVRRTQNASWEAFCHQLMAEHLGKVTVGEGSSPQEAIASFVLLNAKFFGIMSAHYDMSHAMTAAHCNTSSISNSKII